MNLDFILGLEGDAAHKKRKKRAQSQALIDMQLSQIATADLSRAGAAQPKNAASKAQNPFAAPFAARFPAPIPATFSIPAEAGLNPLSFAEDEEKKRQGGGGGGSVQARSFAGSFGLNAPAQRSAIDSKAALAGGSQAAVVKIASYGGGSGYIGNMINYQTRNGEIPIEREDGTLIIGKDALGDMAREWGAECVDRHRSNDVLSLNMQFAEKHSCDEIEQALKSALAGHVYAWRANDHGEAQQIHVVLSAASKEREGNKLMRIYANQKSLDAFEARVEQAFGSTPDYDIHKWAHGVQGMSQALFGLTRGGRVEAQTHDGIILAGDKAASQSAQSWEKSLRSRSARDVAHLILSAKPGTNKDNFVDAARAMLETQFKGHHYGFALHQDRQHLHVHAIIKMVSKDGDRLHPNIADFRRWRESMAEQARERNIPMEATSRFDQAHKPGYRLQDVKMIERGVAPDSVRRRVERVQQREIHVPTRNEGKLRALESARQWQGLQAQYAANPVVGTPPLQGTGYLQRTSYLQDTRAFQDSSAFQATLTFQGSPALQNDMLRLYRGTRGGSMTRSPLFSTDRSVAERFAGETGTLKYLDVPRADYNQLTWSKNNTHTVVVPKSLADTALELPRLELPRVERATMLEFVNRTTLAARHTMIQNPPENAITSTEFTKDKQDESPVKIEPETPTGVPEMSLQNMMRYRDEIQGHILEMRGMIVESDLAKFDEQHLDVTKAINENIAHAQKVIKDRPKLEGAGKTNNAAKHLEGWTFEGRNGELHYQAHGKDGQREATAFVDKGGHIELVDTRKDEALLAALQVAANKWETIQINGTDAYKDRVIKMATEHGFNITNPKLQERLKAEKKHSTAQKDKTGESATGDTIAQQKGSMNERTTPATQTAQSTGSHDTGSKQAGRQGGDDQVQSDKAESKATEKEAEHQENDEQHNVQTQRM